MAHTTSPPARSGTTRAAVIAAARRLIQTRSYVGFSFQDLADAVGLRKASLYHYFATKEALGISVLQDAMAAFETWTASGTRTPREWLDAYFAIYRNSIGASERLCPGGAIVAGWGCVDEALRSAVRDVRRAQITWLTQVLSALPLDGRDPERLASLTYANCQGALITARMTGRIRDFDELIADLRDLLRL